MKRHLKLIWPLFFIASFCKLDGQPIQFKRLTTNDGLPQNSVYEIQQDSLGLIWIGTADGLASFDGYNFKLYSNGNGDIKNTGIHTFFFVGNHQMLLAGDKFIELFNVNTRESKVLLDRSLYAKRECFFSPGDGKTFYVLLQYDGLYKIRINANQATVTKVMLNDVRLIGDAYHVQVKPIDRERFLLIPSESSNRIYMFDSKQSRISFVEAFAEKQERILCSEVNYSSDTIAMCSCINKQCFLSLYKLSESQLLIHQPIRVEPNDAIYKSLMYSQYEQKFYLSDLKLGLVVYDKGLKELTNYSNAELVLQNVQENIFSAARIIRNTIWLGFDPQGISYGDLSGGQFLLYRSNKHANVIKGIMSGKDKSVYAGRLNDTFLHFDYHGHLIPADLKLKDTRQNSLRMEAFNSMFPWGKDSVFIFNDLYFGFYDLNRQMGSNLQTELQKQLPLEPRMTTFFEASVEQRNSIYVSRGRNIYKADLKGPKPTFNKIYTFNSSVSALHAYQGDLLYVGTEQGLFRKGVSVYEKVDAVSAMVKHINKDSYGRYWISTIAGLYCINSLGSVLLHLSTKNSLPNNFIYGTQFHKNLLWASCNKGLFSVDLRSFEVTTYGVESGLQSNEFNSKAFSTASWGDIYFGGVNGISVVNAAYKSFPLTQMKAVLSQFKINGSDVNTEDGVVKLNYKQNNLDFVFAKLCPEVASQVFYRYRLKGYDANYVDAKHNNSAHYSSLPHGYYVFEIQSSIDQREWVSDRLLQINIRPPFWLSWWFKTGMALLLLVLLFYAVSAYYKRKENQYRAEIETLNKIQQERERISRDLHDNAGSLLTYIMMQLEDIADVKVQNVKGAARSLMNTLRETIWAISDKSISNLEFSDKLLTYCKKYVPIETKFDVQIKREAVLQKELVLSLYRISQEALNNVLKHSKANRLQLTLSSNEQFKLAVWIQDDGVGFAVDQKAGSESYGLMNMKKRAAEAGLTFELKSEPGIGTLVFIGAKN